MQRTEWNTNRQFYALHAMLKIMFNVKSDVFIYILLDSAETVSVPWTQITVYNAWHPEIPIEVFPKRN